MSMVRCR